MKNLFSFSATELQQPWTVICSSEIDEVEEKVWAGRHGLPSIDQWWWLGSFSQFDVVNLSLWCCCVRVDWIVGWAPLSYKTRQEAPLSWLREFDTVFCDYYLSSCLGLKDEVVMGRQEVDLHRLQNESGLTQPYWTTPYSSQLSSTAQLSLTRSLSLCISTCLNFFLRPPVPPPLWACTPTQLQLCA